MLRGAKDSIRREMLESLIIDNFTTFGSKELKFSDGLNVFSTMTCLTEGNLQFQFRQGYDAVHSPNIGWTVVSLPLTSTP